MALATKYLANRSALRDGRWVTIGEEGEQFEIQIRAFTNRYRDYLAYLQGEAAGTLNRNRRVNDPIYMPTSLPPSMDEVCRVRAINEHCLLGVRGFRWPNEEPYNGRDVTIDEFRDILLMEEGRDLMTMVWLAIQTISNEREATMEDAVKNSSAAIAGSWTDMPAPSNS